MTYTLRGLDPDLLSAARARARAESTTLDAVLRAALTTYAARPTQAASWGAQGGRVRAQRMSAEERRAAARRAVQARWARVKAT